MGEPFFHLPHHSKKAVESYHVEWNLQYVQFPKGAVECKMMLNYISVILTFLHRWESNLGWVL